MNERAGIPDAATTGVIRDVASVLATGKHTLRSTAAVAGPAVVVSIAYMDPGNFAANIQAGSAYGYGLVWVALASSLVAVLFQCLSARLGVATGRCLAEVCRDRFSRPTVLAMWIVSEFAAMATDLAEFLGAAIGLSLLLHISISVGMGIVGALTYGLLALQRRGFRLFELVIAAFVSTVCVAYLAQLAIVPVAFRPLTSAIFHPSMEGSGAVWIAAAILGATVMPHALFLHSGLTGARIKPATPLQCQRLMRCVSMETFAALGVATLVNVSMIIVAAGAFHSGHSGLSDLSEAFVTLKPLFGDLAATFFLVALLAAGISSSVVGTLAGQMIMQGFTGRKIPVWLRRAITMAPAYLTVSAGVNSTESLVFSQVVLSMTLPAPMFALVWLTSRREVMGPYCNGLFLSAAAILCALAVTTLNLWLVSRILF